MSPILLGFSIAVAFVLGYLLVWNFWPTQKRPMVLIAVPALPAGWSLTSVMYFFWLILSGGRSRWYPAVEVLVLLLALLVSWKRHRDPTSFNHWRLALRRPGGWTLLLLLVAVCFSFIIPVTRASVNPWGYWDAWARINLKARFLFVGSDLWKWIFSSHFGQGDYPLLLSASVARTWTWMRGIVLLGPQVLGIVWSIWSVLLLYSLVAWLRGPLVAVIAGLAYLTFTPLQLWSSAQYSDLPLACFMMLGLAMVVAAEKYPQGAKQFGFLAGFFAGSAAWCKNEGLVFLVLASLWWLSLAARGRIRERLKATGFFGGGAVLIGVAVFVLKAVLAGKTGVFDGLSSSLSSIYALLAEGGRHRILLASLSQGLHLYWQGWPLLVLAIAYLFLHLRGDSRVAHVGPLVCAMVLAAVYYLMVVTTSHDLQWQIRTALDRLLLQLWPVTLFGLAVFFDDKDSPKIVDEIKG